MLTLEYVAFRNFFSYGDKLTTVPLNTKTITLIEGRNLDDTSLGIGANGVGKTVVINAVFVGLYDKPLSDVKMDEMVNNINNSDMEVHIKFTKNNTSWLVKRYRKSTNRSEKNSIELFKDDDLSTNLAKATMAETNDLIQNIIGINFDLFSHIVIFVASNTSFFDQPAATQRQIMEDLFQLTFLSKIAESLKFEKNDLTKELEIESAKIELLEKQQKQLSNDIDKAKSRVETWESEHKSKISQLQTKLLSLHSVDIEKEKRLFIQDEENITKANNINSLVRQAEQLVSSKKQAIEAIERNIAQISEHQIKSKRNEILKNNQRMDDLQARIEELKSNQCPTCKQEFYSEDLMEDWISDIELIKAKNGDIQSNIIDFESELISHNVTLKTSLDELAVVVAEYQTILTQKKEIGTYVKQSKFTSLADIEKVQDQLVTTVSQMQQLMVETNPHLHAYEDLVSRGEKNVIDYSTMNKLNKQLEHVVFLHKALTSKNSFIRKTLILKHLQTLNEQIKFYLNELHLPHRIHFNADLTPSISLKGRNMSYGGLSNGQRSRVNLAIAHAFRDIMQKGHEQVNFCFYDEVLDTALDDVGVQRAVAMLNQLAIRNNLSMFIITHKSEIASKFTNKMTVEFKNDFSSVRFG